MSELGEVIANIIRQLFNGAKRIDIDVIDEKLAMAFEVSAYKVGNVFRIDMKPQ